MQVTVTFRQIEPTEPLRQYAADKLQRLSKHLQRPMGAHVILSVLKKIIGQRSTCRPTARRCSRRKSPTISTPRSISRSTRSSDR